MKKELIIKQYSKMDERDIHIMLKFWCYVLDKRNKNEDICPKGGCSNCITKSVRERYKDFGCGDTAYMPVFFGVDSIIDDVNFMINLCEKCLKRIKI